MNVPVVHRFEPGVVEEALADLAELHERKVPTPDDEPVESQLKGLFLTREELFEAESLHLRAENLALKKAGFIESAQKQIASFDAQLQSTQAAIQAFQKNLGDKYGIDFKTQQIESGTGRVIPAP
jgi:hypothetical protein